MYFTFGSSVCKHKRIRAHILHTRIHRFSRKSPANMRGLSGFRQYSHDPTSLALFARRMSACGGAVVVIFNNKPGHLHGDNSSDSSCAKRIKGGGRGFRGGVTSWYGRQKRANKFWFFFFRTNERWGEGQRCARKMGSRQVWDEDHFVTAVQQKVSECPHSVSPFGESARTASVHRVSQAPPSFLSRVACSKAA